MNVKLTLKLDQAVIEQTKTYARLHGVSLSTLVERYFVRLAEVDQQRDARPTGTVAQLAGLLKDADIDDPKRDYADYLAEKYA